MIVDEYLKGQKSLFPELEEEEFEISELFDDIEDVEDYVNSPLHYGQGTIECIKYIEDFLNRDEYTGYLRGNIAKYLHRWRYKNGVEDLKKAQWYLEALVQQQSRK
jgi:hypothetical protein